MMEIFASLSNIIGLTGVTSILTGYYFLNTNKLTSKNMTYLLLNFVGAWLILFSLFFHWNLSSVVIEIAWISISLIGMYRVTREKNKALDQKDIL